MKILNREAAKVPPFGARRSKRRNGKRFVGYRRKDSERWEKESVNTDNLGGSASDAGNLHNQKKREWSIILKSN